MKIGVVIVAAGRGERAGGLSGGPKQYRLIGGKSVIAHTIETFLITLPQSPIILVTHYDDDDLIEPIIDSFASNNIRKVHGGKSRQASVLHGLMAMADQNVTHVLIHDGVRPFVSTDIIEQIICSFNNGQAAVLPAMAVSDTLKRVDHDRMIVETVSRDYLYAAQTPQGFAFDLIYQAHQKAAIEKQIDFTDDCAIAEWTGIAVQIVDGVASNVKLTTKEDIKMADDSLKMGTHNMAPSSDIYTIPDIRTGNGYDIHQLVDGDQVTLCGIEISHNKKLSGHSDADVALHALTDALLATCGAGDIGDHFPPTDQQWKGVASYVFLEHAVKIVRQKGGIITNADISIIAEEPKIGPHRLKMRENLAKILNIDLARCSIKATTNEKIGCVGRGEGIAAIATASVYYGVIHVD